MGNKNYIKGRRKEYKIIAELKAEGFDIAHRTAGSHSPIDVFAINKETKQILFIQSKPDNFSKIEQERINNNLDWINKGEFDVKFTIR